MRCARPGRPALSSKSSSTSFLKPNATRVKEQSPKKQVVEVLLYIISLFFQFFTEHDWPSVIYWIYCYLLLPIVDICCCNLIPQIAVVGPAALRESWRCHIRGGHPNPPSFVSHSDLQGRKRLAMAKWYGWFHGKIPENPNDIMDDNWGYPHDLGNLHMDDFGWFWSKGQCHFWKTFPISI